MVFYKKNFKLFVGIILAILGIIAIIMGNSVNYYGGYELESKYGGDAYTGIQNAAAQTANNVYNFGNYHEEVYASFMAFIGISLLASGGLVISYQIVDNKLKGSKKNEK